MGYFTRLGPTENLPGDGIGLDAIARAVGMPLQDVRDEIEAIIAEGHLYSTIDDDQ